MRPALAFAAPIKGGYSVEGLETVPYVTGTLEKMTPDGTPILLAPNMNQFIKNLDTRTDQVLGLWIEKFRKLRDECIQEANVVAASGDKAETLAYQFAVADLSNEVWRECFKEVAAMADRVYDSAVHNFNRQQETVLATDGWKAGPDAGPLTKLIRKYIQVMTGVELTDSEIKLAMDHTPDCGDKNCPVHGDKNTKTASPDTLQDALDAEVTREEANRGTRGEGGDESYTAEEVARQKDFRVNGFKDTGLNNGTVFKETDDGIVITDEETLKAAARMDDDGAPAHQRVHRDRDRAAGVVR